MCKEGDLVFDGFSGCGTTNIACIETKRRCISVEKDEGYYNVAKKRLEEAKGQSRPF